MFCDEVMVLCISGKLVTCACDGLNWLSAKGFISLYNLVGKQHLNLPSQIYVYARLIIPMCIVVTTHRLTRLVGSYDTSFIDANCWSFAFRLASYSSLIS